ncbi:MAG: chemotaxis protein CheA [Burkholderiales bacterium]|nr:chemotaxis protein CheA [Burkholderiales bacterium]
MSAGDGDQDFLAEALPAFVSEAREQCDALEQLLLELEAAPDDRDLLDALFRCAHTVKGSAGIFGLERVVGFTHHVETLLDKVREGQLALTPELGTLLLRCNDAIRELVATTSDAGAAQVDAAVLGELVAALQAAAAAPQAGSATPVSNAAQPAAGLRRWHLWAEFGADTFRNGLDPLAVLNYVQGQGTIARVQLDVEAIPPLAQLDPESCHLALELILDSAATRQEIESAFSFVREDCALHIVEPGASVADHIALIRALPQSPRLGDILVSVGAITRAQLTQALQLQAQAQDRGELPRLGEILHEQSGLSPRVVAAALEKQSSRREAAAGPGDEHRFIRVQADRLDAVINLLGELVTAGAGAALLARETRQGALIEANDQIGRLIEEIRAGTLQLRMVPIGEAFSRFRRVVRDTASELGKEVTLEIVGGETELDKSMVERIADPLMHLVRNALDHGLEPAAERLASGKPAMGHLTLSAAHEAGSVTIRIRDDGRGIRRDKVLERAWDRGLLARGVVPPDAELHKLIFEPGFSTAEKVTNLSGRGVGMDVVRRNIESLRGSVAIESSEGRGSTIEIRLPLTLALIDGFLVAVGPSKFIFPLDAVVEVIEGQASAMAEDASGRGTFELRGRLLPVVNLRCLYGLESPPPARGSIVVLQAGGRRFGVLVDTLLGQHQTVIKPLGRMFRSLRGMAGSSILGNGEIALIFDAASLGQMTVELPDRTAQAVRPVSPVEAAKPAPALNSEGRV